VSRREWQALARLTGLTLAIGALFALVALTFGLSSSHLRSTVREAGALAPLAYIVVSMLLTIACFPGPVLAAAAGVLFGAAAGTPIAIVAATGGATLAFLISRRFGARSAHELSGPRVHALQDWIARRGFVAVLYARILPAMPFNVVNYVAGLTRVQVGAFALATAIGGAPRAFAYATIGGNLTDLSSPAAIVAFGVLVAIGALGLVVAGRDVRASRRARLRAEARAGG
jgi:uncharacterized membrane protein YdjX (TVP38/TMEM64 family)